MFIKKAHKILRSRYFWGVLGIALELVQLLAVFMLLYQYFFLITVLGILFHIVVLLYVIDKDEIPEFKVPWLIILLLLPVIGAYIYMLFNSTEQSRKEYRKFEDAHQRLLPYSEQSEAEREELRKRDVDAWSQASYLYHAAQMPCGGGHATYYPLGEKFHAALLESLEQAEKFIFMEYFIIQSGKMWDSIHAVLKEKAAQGVKVYLMYDDFGCMLTLPERYYKEMEEEGIHCVPTNKFKPVLSRIHNNRDHRKITVIDGKVGFTGGVNLADEYINEVVKFGHWKDTAVKIEGEAVRNLTILFLEFWNMQVKEPMDGGPFLHVDIPPHLGEGIVIPYGDGPEPLYHETVGKNVYLNMIHAAREYLYLTTPYLICDHELMGALKLAAEKGVDVRLITPHIPDKKFIFLMTRSGYRELIRSGVRIYEYTPGFVHAKSMVCDDKFAVCGTINLDYRSLVHHFECAAWMYRVDCIADMKEDFKDMLSVSERITEEEAKLKPWLSLLAGVMKIFAPLL